MTDQHPDGWAAVPHVDGIRGTREPAAPVPTPAATGRPRRRLRRRTLVGIVAGGAVVLLLAVTGVVGWTVQSSSHAADRPVRAFLDDLTAGRVTDALDAAGIDHDDQDVLLTDAAYAKASDHVTGYRIAGRGRTATPRRSRRCCGRTGVTCRRPSRSTGRTPTGASSRCGSSRRRSSVGSRCRSRGRRAPRSRSRGSAWRPPATEPPGSRHCPGPTRSRSTAGSGSRPRTARRGWPASVRRGPRRWR